MGLSFTVAGTTYKKEFLLPIYGMSIGALISGIFWLYFLRYYKYSTNLKPILTKTENNAKNESQDQILKPETKVDRVKAITDDLDELKRRLK